MEKTRFSGVKMSGSLLAWPLGRSVSLSLYIYIGIGICICILYIYIFIFNNSLGVISIIMCFYRTHNMLISDKCY